MARRLARAAGPALLALLLSSACDGRAEGPRVTVLDLLQRADAAEKRPAASPFPLGEQTLGAESRASILAPAASRIIWTAVLPRRAVFRVDLGLPPGGQPSSVSVRLGISDHRVYESLAVASVISTTGAWMPLEADLSRYAGPQWSLFYRPEGRAWRLIVTTVPTGGSPPAVYLGEPRVEADAAAARAFAKTYGSR